MKRSFFIVLLFCLALVGCRSVRPLPFAGHTDNKPITRMTYQQWKQSILGSTLYTRYNGKQYRNTTKIKAYKKMSGQ